MGICLRQTGFENTDDADDTDFGLTINYASLPQTCHTRPEPVTFSQYSFEDELDPVDTLASESSRVKPGMTRGEVFTKLEFFLQDLTDRTR